MTELRVGQAQVLAVAAVNPDLRETQAAVVAVASVNPAYRLTQAPVVILASSTPCGTRWAQFWTITRSDDETFYFTSLDQDFILDGIEFKACDSLTPSASQSVSELDAAGSMDLSGAIGPDGITEQALYAGLFDNAKVEAWLIPWEGDGPRRLLLRGTFAPVEQTPTGFQIGLLGDGAKLQQTPLISLLQPGCRWEFGDPITCRKDLGPLTVTGTIDSAIGVRSFVDAARAEAAGYFTRGKVTFTTGDNAGITAEIKEHTSGGNFKLWPRLPFAISAGDQYEMTPGCTNRKASDGGCKGCTAWGQLLRYGGFDKVPGGDARSQTPSAKT